VSRFVSLGFYDLASLFTSYIAKHKRGLVESVAPHHHKVRVLELVNDREELPIFKEWRSAQSFLHKANTRLRELPKPGEVQSAYILAYEPGAYCSWHREDMVDPDCFMRVRALLNPAPRFRWYSADEVYAPPPWAVTAVDHRDFESASNFNAPNTAHELVLELALDVEAP
jgi:hypothetical protein